MTYLQPQELLDAIIEAKSLNSLTPRLATHLASIAEGLSRHRWYNGYSFREDLVAEATARLCRIWHQFDPARSSSAFSYYTRTCQNVFQDYINREREQADILDTLLLEANQEPTAGFEERQVSSTGWAKRRARLDALRKKDLQKPRRTAETGSLPWKPNSPSAFIHCVPDANPAHLDAAYDACNALNITPKVIRLRLNSTVIREVPFDLTRRVMLPTHK